MRTLSSLSSQDKPSSSVDVSPALLDFPSTMLTNSEKIGECLHALRPLLHGWFQLEMNFQKLSLLLWFLEFGTGI